MSTNTATAAAPPLTIWLGCLALTAVLVAISYQWFDRPIATFSHNELRRAQVFIWMQRIPEWFRVGAPICLMAVGVYSLTGRVLAKPFAVLFLASLSLVASSAIKDQLKIVFGRTWPDTWTHNNPSFIRDGAFGFHPFSMGSWYKSFPSGHTTSTCAVIGVLWFCWPKFRPLYVLIVATVAVGLIGANYRFPQRCHRRRLRRAVGRLDRGAAVGGGRCVELPVGGRSGQRRRRAPPHALGEPAGVRETSTVSGLPRT